MGLGPERPTQPVPSLNQSRTHPSRVSTRILILLTALFGCRVGFGSRRPLESGAVARTCPREIEQRRRTSSPGIERHPLPRKGMEVFGWRVAGW